MTTILLKHLSWILAAGALASCGGGGSGAGTPASGTNVTLDAPAADGTRTGALVANGHTVRFTAGPVANGIAQAEFVLFGGTEKVVSQVSAPDTGVITINGVTLDGNGSLTPAEDVAVKSLQGGKLAEAIALIPLEIGCHDAAIDPLQLAALLMPWQLLLKYTTPTRVDAVAALAARSTCTYLPEPTSLDAQTKGPVKASQLRLSRQNPVPTVFGYLPFDKEGAVEATIVGFSSFALSGDTLGPCNALCRGACGADCEPWNCVGKPEWRCIQEQNMAAAKVNTGFKQQWIVQHCGTANGCRSHDDCYDICHSAEGCGTWNAAYCRRGCDQEAQWDHPIDGPQWVMGLGPFDGYLDFPYIDSNTEPVEDLALCPQPTIDSKWEDPVGTGAPMSLVDAQAYCAGLTHDGATWRLPRLDELQEFIQGCTNWNCSSIDPGLCQGCAAGGGPGIDGCYWSPVANGACDLYWTSSYFPYMPDQMIWVIDFAAGGHYAVYFGGEPPATYYVRCIKNQ